MLAAEAGIARPEVGYEPVFGTGKRAECKFFEIFRLDTPGGRSGPLKALKWRRKPAGEQRIAGIPRLSRGGSGMLRRIKKGPVENTPAPFQFRSRES
jgi:hypothetical protein